MKRLLGIGVVALTLFATAGCAVRVHDHFGPPPPPRRAMGYHTHDGRVWVPGHRAQRGGVYVWIEGHWR